MIRTAKHTRTICLVVSNKINIFLCRHIKDQKLRTILVLSTYIKITFFFFIKLVLLFDTQVEHDW